MKGRRIVQLLFPIPSNVYNYIEVCVCYKEFELLKNICQYMFLISRSYILYCDFNVNNVFKCILHPRFYKNILLYRRLRITFLQTLEHYSILSVTFYQLKLLFLCKHNRNSNVLSDFTCFVSVF